jgi:hypothetical protein
MMGADTIAGTAHIVRTGRGFPILRVSPSPSFTASGLSIVTSVLTSTRPTPPSPPARYMLPSCWAGDLEWRVMEYLSRTQIFKEA